MVKAKAKGQSPFRKNERLLIDGYNLLLSSAWPRARGKHVTLEMRRQKLVGFLSELQELLHGLALVTVVFDSRSLASPTTAEQRHHVGQLEVIFPDASLSADDWIEQAIFTGRASHQHVTVVSNDEAIRLLAKRCRAAILSCKDFMAHAELLRADPKPAPSTGPTIAQDPIEEKPAPNPYERDHWLKVFDPKPEP